MRLDARPEPDISGTGFNAQPLVERLRFVALSPDPPTNLG
jgi:hypothetical protein